MRCRFQSYCGHYTKVRNEHQSDKTDSKNLHRFWLISQLEEEIDKGNLLTPIELCEDSDGEIFLQNGHHRLAAYYNAGVTELTREQYNLTYCDCQAHKYGYIAELVERYKMKNLNSGL